MKLFVYNFRDEDEKPFYERISRETKVAFGMTHETPNAQNTWLAKGFDAVNIIYSPINCAIIDGWARAGVKMIISRTVGTDHIDLDYAREKGMRVHHIQYPPDAVADYTVMLMLMGLRKAKYILKEAEQQRYIFAGKMGKSLRAQAVGIIGTGAIGRSVIERLKGFGCEILAIKRDSNADLANEVRRVNFETLLCESDLLSLHLAGGIQNEHLIDGRAFHKMKAGAGIVNTARGNLVDTQALIAALQQKKLSFAALDVIEDEAALYYKDLSGTVLDTDAYLILKSMPNVILSPHLAFYTQTTIEAMVRQSFQKLLDEAG
ncbi:NAD(P)-dependent oxidoreductase [Pseudoramibacter sp. HA2172]|uniref:NAD(P)-dependent oxidoreductase n=1 Tax=Pseudoramibacter faecis TaxID=3108534 RepID=UPI002E75F838|nr:NAD(P)-dependent oxidoreductase [Pseudoramibacter sp. HA2172]